MRVLNRRRRGLLGASAWLLASTAAGLTACGFQLRQPPELRLKRLCLVGFDRYSALGDELRSQLRLSPGVQLVEARRDADAVLEVLTDSADEVATTLTAAGQVRELTLRARFAFRVTDAAGQLLLAPAELGQARQMSYSETNALAKEYEAKALFRAMHSDLALQVLRRLAALPAAAASATPAASS
ncbi:MAG: LPS assembly lipoprotein LptE [Leptothrix sp. (in: b-proteobacteria)]